jgi:hypothetical protein
MYNRIRQIIYATFSWVFEQTQDEDIFMVKLTCQSKKRRLRVIKNKLKHFDFQMYRVFAACLKKRACFLCEKDAFLLFYSSFSF